MSERKNRSRVVWWAGMGLSAGAVIFITVLVGIAAVLGWMERVARRDKDDDDDYGLPDGPVGFWSVHQGRDG